MSIGGFYFSFLIGRSYHFEKHVRVAGFFRSIALNEVDEKSPPYRGWGFLVYFVKEAWVPKGLRIHVVRIMYYPKITSLALQMATGRCWTATGIYEQKQIDELLDTMGIKDVPVERID